MRELYGTEILESILYAGESAPARNLVVRSSQCDSNRQDWPKVTIQSFSEAFERFLGRFPDRFQTALYTIFSILCDA